MDWFYWLFPPLMTAAPLAMVWWAERTLPPAPDTAFRRWGKALLPLTTLPMIVGYLVVLSVFERESTIVKALFYMYFPFWGLAMALTIRPNPNVGESNMSRPERTASLTPRRRQSPIPTAWWMAVWATALVGAAVLMFVAAQRSVSAKTIVSCGMTAAFAVFSVALTRWTLPLALEEAEPLGATANLEIQSEYARFRNQRTWLMFLLFAFGMPILLLGMGAAILWAKDSASSGATVGIVGGLLGSIFGLIGAAVGIGADMKRKRLAEMLKRSDAEALQ